MWPNKGVKPVSQISHCAREREVSETEKGKEEAASEWATSEKERQMTCW